jgi:hypothetical protein
VAVSPREKGKAIIGGDMEKARNKAERRTGERNAEGPNRLAALDYLDNFLIFF